jgi:2-oxoglutarate/2-oxoacid ferredoxin oxidoreductase subunit beta
MTKLMETRGMLTGLIYQNKERKSYENLVKGFKPEGLAKQDIQLTEEQFAKLVAEFR